MILSAESAIFLLLAGGAGAFVRETAKDNVIELPKKTGGKFYLGILGSLIVGAALGYVVDNSPITAFFAGFTGLDVITTLMPTNWKLKKE